MADSVPDPDYVMDDTINESIVIDEPDEPVDTEYVDFDMDQNNINPEEDREAAGHFPEEVSHQNVPAPHTFVVNSPAVDLELISKSYSRVPLFDRLQFVIEHCPPLRRDASIHLINAIKNDSFNAGMYSSLFNSLDHMERSFNECLDTPQMDKAWVDKTTVSANAKLEQLQSEYKKQKDEGVKETTRRAMDELLQHYILMGNYNDALKLFTRGMREYCSQFKHIIQMWLQWLELTICTHEWSRVDPLILHAERAIREAVEAEQVANAAPAARRPNPPLAGTRSSSNKQLIDSGKSKVNCISGINKLHDGLYKQAADKLVKIDVDHLELPWLVSASDLAIYSTLCVLASYDRASIKKDVLLDSVCRKFLESEPRLIELLNSFVSSNFGRSFDILNELKNRFMLDPFINAQVEKIYSIIREKALLLYLRPYSVSKLDEMAIVFRVPVNELVNELVSLIEADKLNARIDAVKNIIRNNSSDIRLETYSKIHSNCELMMERTQLTINRAMIQHARMSIVSEGRFKRKGQHMSDETSDPVQFGRIRDKLGSVTSVFKAFKTQGRQLLPHISLSSQSTEADSSANGSV